MKTISRRFAGTAKREGDDISSEGRRALVLLPPTRLSAEGLKLKKEICDRDRASKKKREGRKKAGKCEAWTRSIKFRIYIFNVITTCIKMYYMFREEKDEIYKFEKIERAFDEI